MRILIVNDDGVDAAGLKALADVFRRDNDVTVIAPKKQRSGYSHSLSVDTDIEYCKVEREYDAYAISGTPADCVKLGVLLIGKDRPFDLVLSGINNGPNLGTDVLYSGTVAAATEGAILGIPSVAVSMETWSCGEREYTQAALFLYGNIDRLMNICSLCGGAVNVNYPTGGPLKGVKAASIGVNLYSDRYVEGRRRGTVRLIGDPIPHDTNTDECDVELIKYGYVTVTPLAADRTDRAVLEKIKGQEDLWKK